ncbi:MAG: hypothetical protein ABI045_04750 [Flavobacteriales bacterium]
MNRLEITILKDILFERIIRDFSPEEKEKLSRIMSFALIEI